MNSETPATIAALSEALERVTKHRDELARCLRDKTAECERADADIERIAMRVKRWVYPPEIPNTPVP